MVSLIRYRPRSMLSDLQQEINHLLGPMWGKTLSEASAIVSDWTPRISVLDQKDHYLVKADMPGVRAEDIDMTLENGVLTLKGERKTTHEEKEENYIYSETTEGSFYRSFAFPETVAEEQIKAKMGNGVLEITVPKSKKGGSKKIPVEVK